ncbi:cardiolipin synthase [Lyngbya confervoides]|uniref:Cardiolipin synthase n=1 Tax=Lyngbya confervoides BDU141951 TaxID=1574623 RepID=A0ABD4T9M0_9CYAN|nr:cardiolipin synthase [Lyngbya confervoides]MCM1985129.1 cardiolipin synthase [Lyngbya confervoides BDU141951]
MVLGGSDLGLWIMGLMVILYGFGLWNAIHAVMNIRTPQGAIAWSLALIAFPWIALPLYWLLGRWQFQGYVAAFHQVYQQRQHEVHRGYQELLDYLQPPGDPWTGLHRLAQSLTEISFTRDNGVQLLCNGEQTFAAMLAAISTAQDYIFLETYILRNDCTGMRFQQALIKQAQRGVQVYLLCDALGSIRLPRSYLKTLQRQGVHVAAFRSTRSWRDRFQMNFRNHRKILIIDGKTGFAGGLNLGDEYLGKVPRFGAWRDTHLQLWGPAVQSLQLAFLKDWYWSRGKMPAAQWQVQTPSPSGNHTALVFPTGPVNPIDDCTYFFSYIIHTAQHRLWIASPYFVPNESILTALKTAALRGVEVRILLPAKADHLLVYLSSFSYYREMQQAGISLYRYEPGFMHQKVLLVDDAMAAVGTVNLDYRSFRLNFEVTVFVINSTFVQEVEAMFIQDFAQSHPVDYQQYQQCWIGFKVAVSVARLLAPLQ